MSVYSVSNKYLDVYDPFWICRLLSLKVGTVTILLFVFNAFLLQPQSAVMYLMITVIATLASEVLPAPTRAKKMVVFIGIEFLLSTTMIIFAMFGYFRLASFLFLVCFTYLSLRLMVSNVKMAALPALMIVYGVISMGGSTTDFNAVANDYLYYFAFGMAGVITILFFPDFSPQVFNSAFLRILESDVANVGNSRYKNSNPTVLAAISVIHSKLPLLPERYSALYDAIIEFQDAFMRPKELNTQEQLLSKSVLSELIVAVQNAVPFALNGHNVQRLKVLNEAAYNMFANLVGSYNQCRV